MPVGIDTTAHRRKLPHLTKAERMYFVTFSTIGRRLLPAAARTIALQWAIRDHGRLCWVDCATVMPDHVHLIVTPFERNDLSAILRRIKGASARFINKNLNRSGPLWLAESFDRMTRNADVLEKKRFYIFENPVRAGLVEAWHEYPWSWSPYWQHGTFCGSASPNSTG